LPKTVVIIPTYNERRNVELLIPKLFDSIKDCHVLIVDDNSPDGTGEFLRSLKLPNLHVLSRKAKLGLGSAYLDGFKWVMEKLDPDIVIQMDADFSHDVKLLPKMAKLVEGGYDLVVGSRYVEGGGVEGWPVHRDMISKGANSLARMMLGLKVKDATSGFKAWSKRAIVNILESHLSSKGFEYQIESILVTSRASMKIIEVPYTFVDRQTGKSKLSTKDMLAFAVSVIRMAGRG
jgi:dolichol-phosphate mannosyltransferase